MALQTAAVKKALTIMNLLWIIENRRERSSAEYRAYPEAISKYVRHAAQKKAPATPAPRTTVMSQIAIAFETEHDRRGENKG